MSDIHRSIRVLGALSLIAGVTTVSAQWQQALPQRPAGQGSSTTTTPNQPGPTQPRRPATGLVVGQVVDAGTGRPVPGAIVTMNVPTNVAIGPDGNVMNFSFNGASVDGSNFQIVGSTGTRRLLTDSEGQFVFGSLPKGSFPISATAPGYVPGNYGQRTVQGPSRPVELDDGQQIGNVTIKLWKYGSISGTVYDEAGEPLVGAQVRVVRIVQQGGRRQLQAMNQIATDDQGRYRFGSLLPGNYLVALPQSVTTVPTSVADGFLELQQMDSELSQLYQRGFNESMAPYPNASNVRVGNQYVQNNGNMRLLGAQPSADGRTYAYQTVFHPAAATSADATVIAITSGLDRDAVDLAVRPSPVFSVSGTLMGPDGPAANMGVRLVPNSGDAISDNSFETAISVTDGNGNFAFPLVPSGQYMFRSTKIPRQQQIMTTSFTMPDGTRQTVTNAVNNPPVPAEPTLWAESPVSVGDANVTGLTISLRKGMRVSGRVVFDGSGPTLTPEALQRMTVNLSPLDVTLQGVPQQTRVGADMQFTTMGFPPGRYIFNNIVLGNGWALKAATLGGRNLDDDPLELRDGDVTGVVLIFGTQFSQLSGTVKNPVGTTPGIGDVDATVVLFPADYATWLDRGGNPRKMRSSPTAKDGSYGLGNMTPGTYFIVAIPSEAVGDTRDLQNLQMLSRYATRVTIADGEKRTVELTLSQIR